MLKKNGRNVIHVQLFRPVFWWNCADPDPDGVDRNHSRVEMAGAKANTTVPTGARQTQIQISSAKKYEKTARNVFNYKK